MDNLSLPQQEQQSSSSPPSSRNGSATASIPPPSPPTTTTAVPSSSPIETPMTYAASDNQSSPSMLDVSVSAIATMTEFDIVNHPIKDTLLIVSSLLSLMIHKNDSRYNPQVDPITLFHSRAVPRISVESYLMRILQFIPFTNEVLLNVLVYLDRIGGLSDMEMSPSGTVEMDAKRERVGKTVAVSSNSGLKPSLNATEEPSTSYPSHSPPQQPHSISTSSPHSCSTASPVNHTSTCITSSKNSKDPESYKSSHPNLSSESPMVHKRGRDDDNLDPNMPKPNLSEHHHRGQTDSQPQNDADLYRALKKTKLEPISSTSNIMNAAVVAAAASMASSEHTQHQSTPTEMTKKTGAIDVQSMPGGSTPAPTPKLAVASNGFRINSFNIHRLLITCIMVAAKFTSDHFYSNARYAKVGGLSLLELNQLELEFLFTTRFELNVKVEELQKVGNSLLRFKNRELASQQTRPQQQYRSTQLDLQRTSLHGNTINTTSCVSSQDSQGLQQKKGRFSIPTPTSPRNGPMSDRTASTSSLPSISSSLSSSPSPSSSSSSLAVTSTAATVSSPTTATVIVVSGDRVQRPQLLSPPEEKHRWAESEVQVAEEHIDQAQERNRSSSQYSSG